MELTSAEYQYDPDNFKVTEEMIADYNNYGYIMIRGLLDKEEMTGIKKVLEESEMRSKYGYGLPDGTGKEPKFVIWGHPGNDVTGMVARSEKVVNTSEKLLGGGEIYHYHAKFVQKDARTGGGLLWHQDYGYWYQNSILFPDLLTAFIAIDKCEKANGCLQILRGSHKCGRIDHRPQSGQHQADLERVEEIKKICPLEFVEMNPGDAIFFSCNLLHTSDVNNSDTRRWVLLFSYNLKSNNSLREHHHPQYTPIEKVPNSAIKECTNYFDLSGKDFLDPDIDKTVKAHKPEY